MGYHTRSTKKSTSGDHGEHWWPPGIEGYVERYSSKIRFFEQTSPFNLSQVPFGHVF